MVAEDALETAALTWSLCEGAAPEPACAAGDSHSPNPTEGPQGLRLSLPWLADTLAGTDRISVLRNTHKGESLRDPRKEAAEDSQILYIVS